MTDIKNEGVIKFKYNLKWSAPLDEKQYIDVEKWRSILFKMNLIGEYPIEKVGFGNLSKRINKGEEAFIITGTQTGRFAHLTGKQYTKLVKCNLQKMSVEASGPIAPSSESLTHHAIYSSCESIQYIFHIHNEKLWDYMLQNNFDSTSSEIDYGTHAMADEAKKCIGSKKSGIFVMAGHQDGIIAYGETAEQAGKIILNTIKLSR